MQRSFLVRPDQLCYMKHKIANKKIRKDHYSEKAKKEHFPARSVYKLQEIQKKYNLVKKGDKVLDLGCNPGSWLLFAANSAGNQGLVVGIDLKPLSIKLPSNARCYTGDILDFNNELSSLLKNNRFNVVLSDMAPSTTGNKTVDNARSFDLCMAALSVANEFLAVGGSFVCKIFQGEDFTKFTDAVKIKFSKHKIFKPQSSRKGSREIFIIGFGKK